MEAVRGQKPSSEGQRSMKEYIFQQKLFNDLKKPFSGVSSSTDIKYGFAYKLRVLVKLKVIRHEIDFCQLSKKVTRRLN